MGSSGLVDKYDSLLDKDVRVKGLSPGIYRVVGFGNGKLIVNRMIDGKAEVINKEWIIYAVSPEDIEVMEEI